MRIVWGFADLPEELNTSFHRVMIPAKRLAEEGKYDCRVFPIWNLINPLDTKAKDALSHAEIVVLERLIIQEFHPYIQKWREQGKKVFATFDDAYHLMPPSGMASFNTWRGGKNAQVGRGEKGSILNEFRKGLGLVDGFLVPSKTLLADYQDYGTGYFVQNYWYNQAWDTLKKDDHGDWIVIGYGGSSAHNISWRDSNILSALAQITREFPKVVVRVNANRDIVQMLEKAQVRYHSSGWMKFDDWPKVVKQYDIGLGIISGNYDLRRSNLKVYENALAGNPWVATQSDPFVGCQGGIFVKNKSKEWYGALKSLILDLELRRSLGEQGKQWATQMMSQCVPDYEKVFNG